MDSNLIEEEVYINLPPLIKGLTSKFSGREKDIVLLSTIGALSSCLPQVYGIYDSKKVFSNLYVMIIAPPASGKGVMNYARLLIEAIHQKVYDQSLGAIEECEDSKKEKSDKKAEPCPELEIKIIPANISSAEMYPRVKFAHFGGVIIESEADTLSVMLKQDWGNFSDLLRKAFHHEPMSTSRKIGSYYLQIERPQLSLVLSGTPDQLQPLVQSKENGLFSRMVYYNFDEISDWKDVFQEESKNLEGDFRTAGSIVLEVYEVLSRRNELLEFDITDDQKKRFNSEMAEIYMIVVNHHSLSFTSSVKRHGLIFFRLCMILSAFRKGMELQNLEKLVCNEKDFNTALTLIKALLHRANSVSKNFGTDVLSELDDKLLYSLSEYFSRDTAVKKAEELGISKRSLDNKLIRWKKERLIKKISHGKYKRI